MDGVQIRRATPNDCDGLFDIWLRSVRATHTFVSEADIESFMPLVRDYLASSETECCVLCDADGAVLGFMGMAGAKMEPLFLAPEFHGGGGGRRLVEHARALRGRLTVDVNEQKQRLSASIRRAGPSSKVDPRWTIRRYPLLHMRLEAPANSHN